MGTHQSWWSSSNEHLNFNVWRNSKKNITDYQYNKDLYRAMEASIILYRYDILMSNQRFQSIVIWDKKSWIFCVQWEQFSVIWMSGRKLSIKSRLGGIKEIIERWHFFFLTVLWLPYWGYSYVHTIHDSMEKFGNLWTAPYQELHVCNSVLWRMVSNILANLRIRRREKRMSENEHGRPFLIFNYWNI